MRLERFHSEFRGGPVAHLPPPDPVYMIHGQMGPIHSLLFHTSPGAEHLYAGTASGKVHIWDLKTNRECHSMAIGKTPCQMMHILNDKLLLAQLKGGTIGIWDITGSSWVQINTLETGFYGFCKYEMFSPNQILVPLTESRVGIVSINTMEIETILDPSELPEQRKLGMPMAMKRYFWHGREFVIVGYETGDTGLWDVTAKKIINWLNSTYQCPLAIEFDPFRESGIIGGTKNILESFEVTSKNELRSVRYLDVTNPGISAVAAKPDHRVFTAGGWDGILRVFTWKNLRPLVALDRHETAIHDIVYSRGRVEAYDSECLMASAGNDGVISLWDIYNH